MSSTMRPTEVLDITGLRDAMGIGLDLLDVFGADEFCALWLGGADGTALDFLVLAAGRGRDVHHLARYASVCGAAGSDIERALLWRRVGAVDDLPALATEFFVRRDQLLAAGIDLVDEIAMTTDEVRSLAVSTLSDPDGWDDVTEILAALEDEP